MVNGHLIVNKNRIQRGEWEYVKYTITVESDAAPQILIGQNLGGATVVGMRQEKVELVSAAEIVQQQGISAATVRRKLAAINQGTEGKFLSIGA